MKSPYFLESINPDDKESLEKLLPQIVYHPDSTVIEKLLEQNKLEKYKVDKNFWSFLTLCSALPEICSTKSIEDLNKILDRKSLSFSAYKGNILFFLYILPKVIQNQNIALVSELKKVIKNQINDYEKNITKLSNDTELLETLEHGITNAVLQQLKNQKPILEIISLKLFSGKLILLANNIDGTLQFEIEPLKSYRFSYQEKLQLIEFALNPVFKIPLRFLSLYNMKLADKDIKKIIYAIKNVGLTTLDANCAFASLESYQLLIDHIRKTNHSITTINLSPEAYENFPEVDDVSIRNRQNNSLFLLKKLGKSLLNETLTIINFLLNNPQEIKNQELKKILNDEKESIEQSLNSHENQAFTIEEHLLVFQINSTALLRALKRFYLAEQHLKSDEIYKKLCYLYLKSKLKLIQANTTIDNFTQQNRYYEIIINLDFDIQIDHKRTIKILPAIDKSYHPEIYEEIFNIFKNMISNSLDFFINHTISNDDLKKIVSWKIILQMLPKKLSNLEEILDHIIVKAKPIKTTIGSEVFLLNKSLSDISDHLVIVTDIFQTSQIKEETNDFMGIWHLTNTIGTAKYKDNIQKLSPFDINDEKKFIEFLSNLKELLDALLSDPESLNIKPTIKKIYFYYYINYIKCLTNFYLKTNRLSYLEQAIKIALEFTKNFDLEIFEKISLDEKMEDLIYSIFHMTIKHIIDLNLSLLNNNSSVTQHLNVFKINHLLTFKQKNFLTLLSNLNQLVFDISSFKNLGLLIASIITLQENLTDITKFLICKTNKRPVLYRLLLSHQISIQELKFAIRHASQLDKSVFTQKEFYKTTLNQLLKKHDEKQPWRELIILNEGKLNLMISIYTYYKSIATIKKNYSNDQLNFFWKLSFEFITLATLNKKFSENLFPTIKTMIMIIGDIQQIDSSSKFHDIAFKILVFSLKIIVSNIRSKQIAARRTAWHPADLKKSKKTKEENSTNHDIEFKLYAADFFNSFSTIRENIFLIEEMMDSLQGSTGINYDTLSMLCDELDKSLAPIFSVKLEETENSEENNIIKAIKLFLALTKENLKLISDLNQNLSKNFTEYKNILVFTPSYANHMVDESSQILAQKKHVGFDTVEEFSYEPDEPNEPAVNFNKNAEEIKKELKPAPIKACLKKTKHTFFQQENINKDKSNNQPVNNKEEEKKEITLDMILN